MLRALYALPPNIAGECFTRATAILDMVFKISTDSYLIKTMVVNGNTVWWYSTRSKIVNPGKAAVPEEQDLRHTKGALSICMQTYARLRVPFIIHIQTSILHSLEVCVSGKQKRLKVASFACT